MSVASPSPLSQSMKRGLLLFAHGARDPRWAEPFETVTRRVRMNEPEWHVQLAYLEFMTPSLQDAGAAMAAAGCDRVDVVPLFLGAGGHVRKDLPQLLDALIASHPQVQWRLQPAIGEIASVTDAMADAAIVLAKQSSDVAGVRSHLT